MRIVELKVVDVDTFYPMLCSSFEKDVMKTKDRIVEMFDAGGYKGYGLLSDLEDRLLGVALIYEDVAAGIVLLDYLAVNERDRGNGYGSYLLREVIKKCGDRGYFIVEMQCSKSDRLEPFYAKEGVLPVNCAVELWGVSYFILCCGSVCMEDELAEKLESMYFRMYPQNRYAVYVI